MSYPPSLGRLCGCGCGEPTNIYKRRPRRFINGHFCHRTPPAEQITETPDTNCWVWQWKVGRNGYGWTWDPDAKRQVLAHRAFYEELIGPIPTGLTIDHLCKEPTCVNPGHLEPVTMAENLSRGEAISTINARKTHCLRGHPFDEANTYVPPGRPRRICRACMRVREAAR